MSTHEFVVLVSGVDFDDEATIDRFFEAGCDDAVLGIRAGWHYAAFHRDADNYADAIASAIADIKAAGGRVHAIEPDTLVSQSDLHRRAGLTRAAISQYVNGKRGADFPPPVRNISGGAPLWDWAEVAEFLVRQGAMDAKALDAALINRAASTHSEKLYKLASEPATASAALAQWAGLSHPRQDRQRA